MGLNGLGRVIGMVAVAMVIGCCVSYGEGKRAFLVGISDYSCGKNDADWDGVDCGDDCGDDALKWSNIHGANDVAMLTPVLRRMGFEVTSLCDGEATAGRIREGLKELAERCRRGDVVYIHFSCHGQPVEDIDGDEEDGWDESIVPADAGKVYIAGIYEGEKHITDDELNRALQRIRTAVGRSGYVTVAVDACHAGTMYRGDETDDGVEAADSVIVRGSSKGLSASGKEFVPKIDRRGRFRVESSGRMSGICMIEACRPYQTNNEIRENGVYYGALSYYIGKILMSKEIDWRSRWYDDVLESMGNDRRLIRQNPVIETGY